LFHLAFLVFLVYLVHLVCLIPHEICREHGAKSTERSAWTLSWSAKSGKGQIDEKFGLFHPFSHLFHLMDTKKALSKK
jgi:hypothetical protein